MPYRPGPGPLLIRGNVPLPDPTKVRVEGITMTVVAMCPCGNKRPIIIPAIPGAGGASQCQACRVTWLVQSVTYAEPTEAGKPVDLKIIFQGLVPDIITP